MSRPARRSTPLHLLFLALLSLTLAAVTLTAPPAGAQGAFPAPAAEATITPGVQTLTGGGQCTANFVFRDQGDGTVYLGQAAHCSGTGGQTATDGCRSGSLDVGTPVEVAGASQPGTLAYSSWLTMQGAGETDPDTCLYNDFALVELDPADHGSVNPSLPVVGGPVAVNTDGVGAGEQLYSYGDSSLRLGITQLSPKVALSLGTAGGGWTHPHYAVTPGIPGDSGSALLDAEGNAVGVLSTLAVLPLPLSNNASDLNLAIEYMQANAPGFEDVELVPGTEPFAGSLLTPVDGLLGGGLPGLGGLPLG